jgi:hypothetical protein
MTNDLVISGLAKRRATLSGEIVQLEKHLKQKLLDLKTIDAAIKVFDPDYPIGTIRPTGVYDCSTWGMRGEMTKLIFSVLRQSSKPVSARDIALQIMAHKEMDTTRPKAVVLIRRRIGEALRKLLRSGYVRCLKEPGQPLVWEVVMPPLAASTPSSSG